MFLVYDQPLYRPPSEADNLILQVTIGCRFNQCSFCSMYKQKRYREKTLDEIQQDINLAQQSYPETDRIFLADGDAFNLPADKLEPILLMLQTAFPRLTRVSCYATPSNITAKTDTELKLLRELKLSLLYVGIETGDNLLLKKITKGASQQSITRSLQHAEHCGIKVSATIILGLGGQQYWKQHIEETVKLLNQAPVSYLSTLQLYLDEISQKEFYEKFSEKYQPQSDDAILRELLLLIQTISPAKRLIFRSNHASNALALAGNLPKDRQRLIDEINQAFDNPSLLSSSYLRTL